MRLSIVLRLLPAVALGACLSGTTTETVVGTPIDCSALATDLTGQSSTLTTTSDSLKYRDVTVGTGATVANGQILSVHYSGCRAPDGLKFDENNDASPTLDFQVGAGALIKGFEEGVVGMKVGGRRQLVLPPALAYGSTGAGNGAIPPNATIVFTIDAVATR
jgi:FKBP-type peptidyl-prolyl cis-trans isomerase